jgi:hypothetical protein
MPADVAFALIYLIDETSGERRIARLAATARLSSAEWACPETVDLRVAGAEHSWPLDLVLASERQVTVNDLYARFGASLARHSGCARADSDGNARQVHLRHSRQSATGAR